MVYIIDYIKLNEIYFSQKKRLTYFFNKFNI